MYIILGEALPLSSMEMLKNEGLEPYIINPCDSLPEYVKTHVDMMIFEYNSTLYMWEDVYFNNKSFFNKLKTDIKLCKTELGNKYPFDICYNVLKDGSGNIYSKQNYTATEILNDAKKCYGVSQGYASCSVCKTGKNGYITSDKGLYDALARNGNNVILIQSGSIGLKGYNYGFIGGASIKISDGKTFFAGNLEGHPDYMKIKKFATENKCGLLYDKAYPLRDIGSGVTAE